jgi:superfamily I DNA/RNA helicase
MFVAGVQDGFVPLAQNPELDSDDAVVARQAMKRERCLFYVSASRARDQLYISGHGSPSPLLGGER